jgi:hypothetical protein
MTVGRETGMVSGEVGGLHSLTSDQQERLEFLMAKNNAGPLTNPERIELQSLARATEEITLANALLLAGHRQPLSSTPPEIGGSAA